MADAVPSPLTQLSEEESLFQASVRRFARERLAPHVRAMDEAGVFRKDLIAEMFELGLMASKFPRSMAARAGLSSSRFWRSRSWPRWTRRPR